jgi:hypothetical protein
MRNRVPGETRFLFRMPFQVKRGAQPYCTSLIGIYGCSKTGFYIIGGVTKASEGQKEKEGDVLPFSCSPS